MDSLETSSSVSGMEPRVVLVPLAIVVFLIVGVVFLGDKAVDGLGWLAAVGFVCAIIGASLVAWLTSEEGEQPAAQGAHT